MRNKRPAALAAIMVLLLVGCAKQLTPAHPNQINSFDGAAYDTLITVQGSLQQAKALEPQYPQYKGELNEAISAYNAAIAGYKLYHSAAADAPDAQALQAQVTALVTSVSRLLADLGVKL